MYQKAQLYMIYTIAEGAEEDKLYDSLEKSLNLNMAFVSLKQKKYRDAINFCMQVLKHDPSNLKAQFRLVKAHIELIEFTEADQIIQKVLEKDSKNRDFLELKNELSQAVSILNIPKFNFYSVKKQIRANKMFLRVFNLSKINENGLDIFSKFFL